MVELRFDYGGVVVLACDPGEAEPIFHPTGLKARNLAAEEGARRALEGMGAVEIACLDDHATAPDSQAHYLLRVDGDVHDVCSFHAWAVPQLRALGWRVEIAPDYPYRIVEQEPTWYARVEPDGERPDWFGLELGVELDGHRVNLLSALLDLLEGSAHGQRLAVLTKHRRHLAVPLPDGRLLPVAAERLRGVLRVLGELYGGKGRKRPAAIAFPAYRADALERIEMALGTQGRPVHWEGSRQRAEEDDAVVRAIAAVPPPAGLLAELRPYQKTGLEWLQHLRARGVGGVLADDMGLGKTLQAIAHVLAEKEAGRLTSPALVVTPTSLLGVWQRELARFAPGLGVVVLHGAGRHGMREEAQAADVVITSYPIVLRDAERLAERPFHLLILDEAHTVKNGRSQVNQAVRSLRATHRLCVTGTPIENHLGELWTLFDLVNPGLLGDELAFRRFFRVPIEQHGDDERLAVLRQHVAPYMLRRLKEEVATELPPKTELARPAELEGAQRELYESIRVSAHAAVRRAISDKGLAASTVPILDALTKLRQVCCDPRLVPLRSARSVRESAKYDLLFSLLEAQLERGRRILVFSQFTRMLALIARGLHGRKIEHLVLTGETRERQRVVDAFEHGRAGVFLISLKAGGVGLTLTSADTVIHYDPWWNPAAQDQATDRAYRIGQTKPVVAYSLFVAGSVEQRILELQQKKRRLGEGVLSGTARAPLSEIEVDELFAPLV